VLKQAKRRLCKNEWFHLIDDYARLMFRAFKAAGASPPSVILSNVQDWSIQNAEGTCTLEVDEHKVFSSAAFRDV
jgi:hypothetical protein